MFHHFGIESEIDKIYQRKVNLPGGGSIVLQETEALLAIDVNSGRASKVSSPEELALRTNLEAAIEIARQIRLRDIGGVIVIDFIDMAKVNHRKAVEQALRKEVARDRAQTKILPMSQFCIVQMTRQKIRPSLTLSTQEKCPTCDGRGYVKSIESVSLIAIRRVKLNLRHPAAATMEIILNPEVASYLLNNRRREIVDLEDRYRKRIVIRSEPTMGVEEMIINLYDRHGTRLETQNL